MALYSSTVRKGHSPLGNKQPQSVFFEDHARFLSFVDNDQTVIKRMLDSRMYSHTSGGRNHTQFVYAAEIFFPQGPRTRQDLQGHLTHSHLNVLDL
jgi:hypothetical protein